MGVCEVCGNDYDKSFRVVTSDNGNHVFDSLECAIQSIAPVCKHCQCRIIGHGVEVTGTIYCSAHCAAAEGALGPRDRVD